MEHFKYIFLAIPLPVSCSRCARMGHQDRASLRDVVWRSPGESGG
jgi:hypothetical protein